MIDAIVHVVRLPLNGRVAALVTLSNPIGENDGVRLFVYRNPGDAEPIITKSTAAASLTVTDEVDQILFDLTGPEAALLYAQRLYTMRVELLDGEVITAAETFVLMPVHRFFSNLFTSMSVLLSTRFLNTLDLAGETGGAGYLDGVVTVGQPAGTDIQFRLDDEPPQQWTLEEGNTETEAGAYVRPLDYSADTNMKFWRRIA